jgi:dTMP kinase
LPVCWSWTGTQWFAPASPAAPRSAKPCVVCCSIRSTGKTSTQALLFAADRRIHLPLIRQALGEGKIVLCDRYIYSNIAYQVAGGADRAPIEQLDVLATGGFRPSLAFWLDLDPSQALARVNGDARTEPDRYDGEIEFQQRLHSVYLEQLANSPELRRVDADRPADEVAWDVYEQIRRDITLATR